MKFFFDEFTSIGYPSEQIFTQKDKEEANSMKKVCMNLVKELGGTLVYQRMSATFIVFFQDQCQKDKFSRYRRDQKIINFRYITECYFQMLRLNPEGN